MGCSMTVGPHMVHGAQDSLRDGDPIRLTKFVYSSQPSRDIDQRRVVSWDIPRFDDGLNSLGCEDVLLRNGLVTWRGDAIAVITRAAVAGGRIWRGFVFGNRLSIRGSSSGGGSSCEDLLG